MRLPVRLVEVVHLHSGDEAGVAVAFEVFRRKAAEQLAVASESIHRVFVVDAVGRKRCAEVSRHEVLLVDRLHAHCTAVVRAAAFSSPSVTRFVRRGGAAKATARARGSPAPSLKLAGGSRALRQAVRAPYLRRRARLRPSSRTPSDRRGAVELEAPRRLVVDDVLGKVGAKRFFPRAGFRGACDRMRVSTSASRVSRPHMRLKLM